MISLKGLCLSLVVAATQALAVESRNLTEECLEFIHVPGHSLYGHNDQILHNVQVSECSNQCVVQTLFLCRSFEFNINTGTCYLSAHDQHSEPQQFGPNPNTDYYQRSCHHNVVAAKPTSPTLIYDTSTLTSFGRTMKPVTKSTQKTPEGGLNPSNYEPGEISYKKKFAGTSYMELSQMARGSTMSILTLDFVPYQLDGLLLYMTDVANELDFMSLALIDGYVEFRYDLGSGPAVLKTTNAVEPGAMHRVLAARVNKEGKLHLDDSQPVIGESQGDLRSLNVDSDIFLGNVPIDLKDRLQNTTDLTLGYSGCIEALHVQGFGSNMVYDLDSPVSAKNVGLCGEEYVTSAENSSAAMETTESYNVSKSEEFLEITVSDGTTANVTMSNGQQGYFEYSKNCAHIENSCNNQGVCIPDYETKMGYRCECQKNFVGGHCEHLLAIDYMEIKTIPNLETAKVLQFIGRTNNSDLEFRWFHNGTETKDIPLVEYNAVDYIFSLGEADGYVYTAQMLAKSNNQMLLTGAYTCIISMEEGSVLDTIHA